MPEYRYALIRPDEDGNHLKLLSEKQLKDLLTDPMGNYRIAEFEDQAFLDQNPDPNYWGSRPSPKPDITLGYPAVLIRYEVVVPVPGGYRIPD